MEKLENERGYPYIEDLALEAARYYNENGRMDESVKCTKKKVMYAENKSKGATVHMNFKTVLTGFFECFSIARCDLIIICRF
ncbi:hypothetical protein BsIDN1_67320 [Bacillus safensis]|uniref:Uncharacterized protein n=1 Tax=Bacillus safensis TaxID=561879 RepID=A0A5S9MLI4_BACIA|nr:hypothetical protein BsIDN1_67320 [Bacillus safensis]